MAGIVGRARDAALRRRVPAHAEPGQRSRRGSSRCRCSRSRRRSASRWWCGSRRATWCAPSTRGRTATPRSSPAGSGRRGRCRACSRGSTSSTWLACTSVGVFRARPGPASWTCGRRRAPALVRGALLVGGRLLPARDPPRQRGDPAVQRLRLWTRPTHRLTMGAPPNPRLAMGAARPGRSHLARPPHAAGLRAAARVHVLALAALVDRPLPACSARRRPRGRTSTRWGLWPRRSRCWCSRWGAWWRGRHGICRVRWWRWRARPTGWRTGSCRRRCLGVAGPTEVVMLGESVERMRERLVAHHRRALGGARRARGQRRGADRSS